MSSLARTSVRIVYPSYPYKSLDHLNATLDSIKKYSIEPIFMRDSVDPRVSPPYSHTHEKRAKEIITAIEEECPYIWAAAGGSGSIQVVSEIEKLRYIPTKPKFGKFIGFSDATHLHGLWAKWRGISYHAPNAGLTKETDIAGVGINNDTTLEEITQIIKKTRNNLSYDFKLISDPKFIAVESIQGSIIGGNVQLLVEMQGSPTAINPKGKFIFLEDIINEDEADYLTRRLSALRRQGLFKGAKGILFGNLLVSKSGFNPDKQITVIQSFIRDDLHPNSVNIPVLYSKEFGHGQINRILPFGTNATLFPHEGLLEVSTQDPFKII